MTARYFSHRCDRGASVSGNNPGAGGCLKDRRTSGVYYSFRKSENFTKELLQLYDSLSALIYARRSDGILFETRLIERPSMF